MLGAAQGQTLLADSTSVCFYKLAGAALTARPDRRRIVTNHGNFPTDRYVLEGLARRHDRTIVWTDPTDAHQASASDRHSTRPPAARTSPSPTHKP
jgi:kynureninase